jgi:predicted PurR-regulated permease PerM
MKEIKVSLQEKRALAIATAIAIVFGAYFLSSFFILVVLAGILAFLFNPFYVRLCKRMSPGAASALVLLTSIFVVVGPLTLIIIFAGAQISNNINSLANAFTSSNLTDTADKIIEFVNNFLATIPFVHYTLTEQSLIDGIKNISQAASTFLLSLASSIASSFFGLITSSIIYMYVFVSLLKNSNTLITVFRKLNPLGDEISNLYLEKIGAMILGTVRGQFIIAVVQGFLGAATFALVGYPQFFFIIFVLFSIMSIIPLGAGILAIPIAVIMILFGQVWQGLAIIGEHVLINSNVDNVLRPILVPKKARLDAALMLLSVFAGMRLFGFLGIVIGPTIIIIIVTTIRVYLDIYEDYRTNSGDSEDDKKSKLWFLHRKEKKASNLA